MRLTVPAPPRMYVKDYPRLTGGLNTRELNHRLREDESPFIKNLWWQDGMLQCRDGQTEAAYEPARGKGLAAYEEPFYGYTFLHIGNHIYYGRVENRMELTELPLVVPEERGTFFRYQDRLFYKNRGGFFCITCHPDTAPVFSMDDMTALAYTPIIQINTKPGSGAGESYQPENRLSAKKTVWYTAEQGVTAYQLPITAVDAVHEVEVDGRVLEPGTEYRSDLKTGVVTFSKAPQVSDPPVTNTVRITFSKEDPKTIASILDCRYAFVAGTDQKLCILLAGSTEQPNGVFWNANTHLGMDPGYWPMPAYNLVGSSNDPVTGFGQQYADTIVFQTHSLGKLEMTTDTVDQRRYPLFLYKQVNDKLGCDLPWSIQLIENNLVFCNSYQGVQLLRSSSAAYENNVTCLSLKVNHQSLREDPEFFLPGLLTDLRNAERGLVCSFDDDSRYWLCVNGRVYLWDYTISGAEEPSWFYFTGLEPVSLFRTEGRRTCHLDGAGRVTRMTRSFSDYGRAIEKVYQFPVCNFGSYDRLKDVHYVLLTTRSDTESIQAETTARIRYDTDYETRYDRTDVLPWRLHLFSLDLNKAVLGFYNFDKPKYARVSKRIPGCRHIRHFSMTLSNGDVGADLGIVSARIAYSFAGKER